ncbi:hypothetical protein ACSW9O_15570 (plasmid) [Clostridium perfringens]
MKVSIDFEITNCGDCPFLTKGRTFGNDGRDGVTVYKCKKGVFGGTDEFGYDTGNCSIPKAPPYGCQYIKADILDRVSSKLNISTNELRRILNEEHCELKEF